MIDFPLLKFIVFDEFWEILIQLDNNEDFPLPWDPVTKKGELDDKTEYSSAIVMNTMQFEIIFHTQYSQES
jgi:hypothetical protein